MFLRELDAALDHVKPKRTGEKTFEALARLGIVDVGTLLCHYPRKWEDRSEELPLNCFNLGNVYTTVTVLSHGWFYANHRRTLKIIVEDDTAKASLVCYNRSFWEHQLLVGMKVKIYGEFKYEYGELQSKAFEIVNPNDEGLGKILPIYPLTEGLSQNILRRFMRRALDIYTSNLENELPEEIIKRDDLYSKPQALQAIHFPSSYEARDRAEKTIVYEELFYLEMIVGKRAMERRAAPASGKRAITTGSGFSPLQKRLIERLPFSLTPGQIETAGEINRDMDGPYPMARLLQGDVGSGKTLVSFLACLRAVEEAEGQRGQAALMAPTELLARQHAENAAKLLEPLGLRIAFLTGNIKAAGRAQLLKALAAGEIDIVAGTHALFSRDTIYSNLRLVVIDEQHRFGVTQRQAVMAKGQSSLKAQGTPDLLMMSATPIPRTLALTVFGDLDVSVIRDMPPGRKPIKTHLVKESNENKVYDFARKELAAGHQAYFVYPLIGEGEPGSRAENLKDVTTMAEKLAKTIFPKYPVALIHSRLDEEEKQKAMEAFRRGEVKVLAATSVVEVGVDVPNATCMVIEHAERFGLSALHQLRGRVGRGEAQSYCILIYSDQEIPPELVGVNPEILSEDERSKEGKRLMVMLKSSDGFEIAEKDLILRGPGQIAGIEQSGYLALGLADPVRDADKLARARADAFAILEKDPGLLQPENRRMAAVLERAPPFGLV
ncbi:ATP-dependent DNA helicase RecG [Leadbettera azotonutricia]|uniref:ATP-dependent DNA helicase RecG n=1 Tax=Leadbettera azotonutricia (strain ATCC BAA-888 / DSM 13862 / ZAS-9) TaxID=545695 RepID=F5YAH1_LEAAZ|nr:ATP-dependent DNA helicase RecG [Leadbettera azotonutricia]AEF82645.1 ATP-dependent DNA helicase RecG [Leadbettera azotonutricia ZAS-9]